MNDDRSRRACAQLPLTCAHAHTRAAAQVDEIAHVEMVDGVFDFAHAYLLAFTHYCLVFKIVELDLRAECAVAFLGGLLSYRE